MAGIYHGVRMADRPMTARQKEVADFIGAYHDLHGVAPTVREIGAHLGVGSTNAVMCFLKPLRIKGVLTWTPGKGRTIRLLTPSSVEVETLRAEVERLRGELEEAKLTIMRLKKWGHA